MIPLSSLRSRLRSALGAGVIAASAVACVPAEPVTVVHSVEPAPERVATSISVFYDELSPYGEWIEVEPYGRVFRPSVDQVGGDFVPYSSGGSWVHTSAGWSFQSDWEWGWATFHYGRWFYLDGHGWLWVPDTIWGPAWVDWHYGDEYIGWAPLGPPGFVVVERHWVFVEHRHFIRRHVRSYVIPPARVHVAIEASPRRSEDVVRGDVRWHVGPPVAHVTRRSGTPITTIHVVPPRSGTVVVRSHTRTSPAPARRPARPGPR
jgi:hypothetical protein